jgi:hypothetical protein
MPIGLVVSSAGAVGRARLPWLGHSPGRSRLDPNLRSVGERFEIGVNRMRTRDGIGPLP